MASAQSQRDGDSAVTLTPEQRAIVGDVVKDELQDRLGNRIADRLSQLHTRAAGSRPKRLKQRLAAEVREGLSDRISDKLGAGSGDAGPGIKSERVSGEIRDRLRTACPAHAGATGSRPHRHEGKDCGRACGRGFPTELPTGLQSYA